MSSKPVNQGGSIEATEADWVGKEAFAGPTEPGNSVWPDYEGKQSNDSPPSGDVNGCSYPYTQHPVVLVAQGSL